MLFAHFSSSELSSNPIETLTITNTNTQKLGGNSFTQFTQRAEISKTEQKMDLKQALGLGMLALWFARSRCNSSKRSFAEFAQRRRQLRTAAGHSEGQRCHAHANGEHKTVLHGHNEKTNVKRERAQGPEQEGEAKHEQPLGQRARAGEIRLLALLWPEEIRVQDHQCVVQMHVRTSANTAKRAQHAKAAIEADRQSPCACEQSNEREKRQAGRRNPACERSSACCKQHQCI